MHTKIEIILKPFSTPNFVLSVGHERSLDGQPEETSYPLSAIDAQTLERMCEDFTNDVFKKAKKQRPPQDRAA